MNVNGRRAKLNSLVVQKEGKACNFLMNLNNQGLLLLSVHGQSKKVD